MFKKGDVVEVIEAEAHWSIKVGEKYTLKDDQSGEFVYIGAPACQSYKAKRFKLIHEGHVRTVTRQKIIPGTYDGVGVNVGPEGELFIEVTPMATRDPDRLERAAAVLAALAGALRDGE